MSYIFDAILESNALEDNDAKRARIDSKKPKTLKRREKKPEITESQEITDEVDVTEEPLEEAVLTEEKMVNIEDYMDKSDYITESKQVRVIEKLADRPQKGRPGSPEYEANVNRKKREASYRKFANIPDDYEITEDNINNWALTRVCTDQNCTKEKLKAELLKQPYTGLEEY